MSANDELQAHTCEKMLEFYGNVANNVVQGKVQDLTEQWKKGELEKGKRYWCKLQDGKSEICYLWLQTNHFTSLTGYQSRCLPDEDIVEVLAPLSSFEEWQKLKEFADYSLHNRNELTRQINYLFKENNKLKELLKECRDEINPYIELFTHKKTFEVLLTKINEVLK